MEADSLGDIQEAVISGIYCLLHNNKIVYIGQSNSIIRRVGWHLGQNKKKFNQFSYIQLTERREDLEAELIARFKPKYNQRLNPKFWKYKKSTWDRKSKQKHTTTHKWKPKKEKK